MFKYLAVLVIFALFILTLPKIAHSSEYIPTKSFLYIKTLSQEEEKFLPGFKYKPYFASLIEQESCLSLTHSRCWSPTSRLKTKREEGAGLAQLTKAYRKDGSLRFDNVKILKSKYKKYLKDLSWDNIYTRPDLQIRSMLLLWRGNYNNVRTFIDDELEAVIFSNAAYNGGLKGVRNDRRLCNMKKGCNPNIWFDNVEDACSKSKKILYGKKSACDINREHTKNIFKVRYDKYQKYFNCLKIG